VKKKKLKKLLKKAQEENLELYKSHSIMDMNLGVRMSQMKSLLRLMPIDLNQFAADNQDQAINQVFTLNEMYDLKVKELRAGTGAIKRLHELGAFTAGNKVWGVPVKEVRTLRSMEIEVVSQDSLRDDDVDNYRECILGV
jgi:hypothetical protein